MMRCLFLLSLLLSAFSTAAQPKHYIWPRNARTDSVEFRGVLPWPSDTLTEAQRVALVRQWHRTHLMETSPKLGGGRIPHVRTYGGLPAGGYLELALVEETCRLRYQVELRPTPAGLAYRLWEFYFACAGFDASGEDYLESMLALDPVRRIELDRLQHRLRVALAHW